MHDSRSENGNRKPWAQQEGGESGWGRNVSVSGLLGRRIKGTCRPGVLRPSICGVKVKSNLGKKGVIQKTGLYFAKARKPQEPLPRLKERKLAH